MATVPLVGIGILGCILLGVMSWIVFGARFVGIRGRIAGFAFPLWPRRTINFFLGVPVLGVLLRVVGIALGVILLIRGLLWFFPDAEVQTYRLTGFDVKSVAVKESERATLAAKRAYQARNDEVIAEEADRINGKVARNAILTRGEERFIDQYGKGKPIMIVPADKFVVVPMPEDGKAYTTNVWLLDPEACVTRRLGGEIAMLGPTTCSIAGVALVDRKPSRADAPTELKSETGKKIFVLYEVKSAK